MNVCFTGEEGWAHLIDADDLIRISQDEDHRNVRQLFTYVFNGDPYLAEHIKKKAVFYHDIEEPTVSVTIDDVSYSEGSIKVTGYIKDEDIP